ncbi:MAG: hypothetical protein HKN76_19955 [Saprospiraceae bacterium]|nr:hypothetical protein [Saprospiraceae bacterium]
MKNLWHILTIIIFALFAYWQLNDPDPFLWIPIYLGVSIIVLLFIMKIYLPYLPLICALGCLVGLLLLSPEFVKWIGEGMPTITGQMKAESPHVELVREFLGYAIAGSVYYSYFRLHKRASLMARKR